MLETYRGEGCKFSLGLDIKMASATASTTFRTKATTLLSSDDALTLLLDHVERLSVKVDDFVRGGSGWISLKVDSVYLYITKYVDLFREEIL